MPRAQTDFFDLGCVDLWVPNSRLAIASTVLIVCAAMLGTARADQPSPDVEVRPDEATLEGSAEPPEPGAEDDDRIAVPADEDIGYIDSGILDDLDELGLFDDFALLAAEDFVVSATRHAQPIEESPAAITVITREQIRQSGYVDLIDLLRLVPGADVFQIRQGHLAMGLRSRSHDGGDLVLALIDGRDFAAYFSGTPYWAGMPIDLLSIERVEIIRGPSSTLYGANALQGVVNVVTRRPEAEPFTGEGDAWISAPMGHAANVRAHGTADRFSWWASAGHDRRTSISWTDEPSMEIFRGRLFGGYRFSEESELTTELGLAHGRSEGHLMESGPGAIGVANHYWRTHMRLGRTELQLVVDYSVATLDIDFGINLPGEDGAAPLPLLSTPSVSHPSLSVHGVGQHHVDLFHGNRLTAGLSVQGIHHMAGSMVVCPDVETEFFDREDCYPLVELEARGGVFVQDEWRITDSLQFTGGLRLDLTTFSPEPAFSPRAALVWKPAQAHALRASYGRAYRKPTFLQVRGHVLLDEAPGAPSDLSRRLVHLFVNGVGNPDLRNEKADSYEIGWRGRFLDGRLIATTDLFHGRYWDIIWFAADASLRPGLGGVYTLPEDAYVSYFNVESEKPLTSWGGEAMVSYQPTPQLELRAIYGLDILVETGLDDERLDRREQSIAQEPMHRLAGALRWKPLPSLTTSLDVFWAGSYEAFIRNPVSMLEPAVSVELGGQVVVNGSVAYRLQFAGSSLELGAALLNIPDLDVYEVPWVDAGGTHFGGERLSRRLRVFVRGQY